MRDSRSIIIVLVRLSSLQLPIEEVLQNSKKLIKEEIHEKEEDHQDQTVRVDIKRAITEQVDIITASEVEDPVGVQAHRVVVAVAMIESVGVIVDVLEDMMKREDVVLIIEKDPDQNKIYWLQPRRQKIL